MTTTTHTSAVILIAGHWLGAWAWDEVLEHLTVSCPNAIALTLPGLDENDPDRETRTLDEQVAAILDLVVQHGGSGESPVVLVAHSGANAPVSLVLDQHPELVQRVVWVDSGPMATGSAFAADLPRELTDLPLPSFDVLTQQASLDGLSEAALERFRTRAVPEPAPVLRQTVVLNSAERRSIPTTLVCCSIPSTQMLELARTGHPMFAEVALLEHLNVVDLPTGHWPMWSRPADLAKVIELAVSQNA